MYLFSFVLQMTRLPTGTLPEAERRARLPGSRSLCFIIFACFASFPHRRGCAKQLNGFMLPSSGTQSPDPEKSSPDSRCWREKGSAAPGTRLTRLILTGDGCRWKAFLVEFPDSRLSKPHVLSSKCQDR